MYRGILVIEDHPLYSDALQRLLQDLLQHCKITNAASAEEGLRLAPNIENLDLVLLDLNLPGLSGSEAVAAFYKQWPTITIIVISGSDDRRDVAAVFRAGARVFISKHASTSLVISTIQRALAKQLSRPEWIRSAQNTVFLEHHDLPLNARQKEILSLLSQGCTNREIAQQVGLAEITVKQYVSVIFRVLGVENRAQALLAIRRFGLGSVS